MPTSRIVSTYYHVIISFIYLSYNIYLISISFVLTCFTIVKGGVCLLDKCSLLILVYVIYHKLIYHVHYQQGDAFVLIPTDVDMHV